MTPYIKNLAHETVVSLAAQVSAQDGQIVSKTLAQNRAVSLTLFAFSQGEEIPPAMRWSPCWKARDSLR